jgi:hypothetical protein
MSSNPLSVTPSSAILSPNDSVNNLNLLDFSNIGRNLTTDSTAFKKIQNFSKLNPQFIYTQPGSYYSRFNKINNLYINELTLDNVNSSVSIYRQHNYTSLKTSLNMFTTLVDTTSFKKFFNYTADNHTTSSSPKVAPILPNEYLTTNSSSLKSQNLQTLLIFYAGKFTNQLSLGNASFFKQNTSLSEHFLTPSNPLLAYIPSTKPLTTFVKTPNLNTKDYDFAPNDTFSASNAPHSMDISANSFKTLNLKSGGQSITTQEKSLREIMKSNPANSFQNSQLITDKTFSSGSSLPFNNHHVLSMATLG